MKEKITLSSKGQVVIPKSIREALQLEPGDTLVAEVSGGIINLRPRDLEKVTDELKGRFSEEGLVAELEEEHRKERDRDLRS